MASERNVRRILATAAAAGLMAVAGLGISSASAAPERTTGGCRAGTWGSVWGWGDCRGIGRQKWQLKVSCTWAASATSNILTGDGHVDVKCPWGSARTASIIFR